MPADNRIESLLCLRSHTSKGALLPYFTSGFPDVGTTIELIRRADALGAKVVEIGIPFSDSIADGPVIQASFHHVLSRGYTLEDTFNLAAAVRPAVRCGLVAMVSFSLVTRGGVAAFMDRAAAAGFDGVIVPDVPVEEAQPIRAEAGRAGLCYIGLVAPTTLPPRREAIARASSGFVYSIAVAGTTGELPSLPPRLPEDVAELRRVSGLPVCVGFGISTIEHVRAVCRFADGAIVGSALVRRIKEAMDRGASRHDVVESVSGFLAELMRGIDGRRP